MRSLLLILLAVCGLAAASSVDLPDPPVPVVTIAKAVVAPDGSWISLEAEVVERLEPRDRYRLRDRTGAIEAEIQQELWAESGVALGDRVQLRGVVDLQVDRRSIQVEELRPVRPEQARRSTAGSQSDSGS